MSRLVFVLFIGVLVLIFPAASSAESAAAIPCSPIICQNSVQNFSALDQENCSLIAKAGCEEKKWNDPWEFSSPAIAIDWKRHFDNIDGKIASKCMPSEDPAKDDVRLLKIVSNGSKSGVFLELPNLKPNNKRMTSTRVWVRSGRVAIAMQGGTTRPSARSTKVGEWEQLQICTDATAQSDSLVIYNQVKGGGRFVVDRIEMRDIH